MLEHKHLDQTIQRLQQRYAAVKRWRVGGDVILAMTLVGFVMTLAEALSPWSISFLAVYGAIVVFGERQRSHGNGATGHFECAARNGGSSAAGR